MLISRRTYITIALTLVFIFWVFVAFSAAEIDKELKAQIDTAIERGIKYLQEHQDPEGSYGKHAGITALVATAYMRCPKHYTEKDGAFLKDAIKYIVSKAEPDGSIYDRGPASYITAVALMALVETKNPEYKEIIKKAQQYMLNLQIDEGEGISGDNNMYGGFGYGKINPGEAPRADLSNLHFSLEALKASGVPKDADVWDKAIKFIERCQNRSESNDQKWAKDDGGFIYQPSPRSENESRSYGSMTYAGIESFIYANVDKNDPRVQDAVKWIKNNYSLDENPPIGLNGLYYYYHTMAKAFNVYGERTITDSKGVKHDWYEELALKLVKLQKEDGSWVNEADRWMESNPILVTAYAILALSIVYPK